MTTESSHGARTREPVYLGQRRIPNLWQRTLANGETAFEFVGRVDGRVLRRRLTAATKSEAVTEARGLATDRDRGELRARPTAPTVPELRDEFLEHLRSLVGDPDERRRRSQACVNLYERHLDVRFVPEFRARRVDEITTADLRRWLDKLRRTKLAPNTQRGVLTAASAMLRYAAKQAYIPMSPAAGLDRDDRPSTARKRQPRYLNAAQLGALLGKLDDDYRPLGAMLAYAGLRVSEALAVRWRDLDLDAGRLTVAAQLDRAGQTVPLKTTASGATVDLLPALVRELRAHRTRRAALGIHLVRADALTFSTRTGKPHHQRSALRAVQTAATAAKLGHVTAHDLRHSLVANALDAGLTLAEASRLARHASPAVTAAVYADVLEANRETLGAKLARAGFGV
jgi:integrase